MATPPPPPGFTLDNPDEPPPGFALDAPRGFVGSGGAGPGSVDPDAADPDLHVSTLQGLRTHTTTTPEQRARKLAADAEASHTDDPGVQAIAGGIMGAGAGSLIGAVAPAAIGARATNLLQAAGAGGVASTTQGGDFTTGALLGGATAALPAGAGVLRGAGEAAGSAARKLGEEAIERSAARGATPIKDAIKAGGGDLLHGHVVKPLVRVGATAADEAGAALARRMLKPPAPVAPAADAPATAPIGTNVPAPSAIPAEAAPPPPPPVIPEAAPAPVPAPAPAAPVADVEAILKPATPPLKPAWEPGRGDAEFARKLGMSTEKYRDMMTKRMARLSAKDIENIKVAKLVRLVTEGHSSKSVAAAADEAISAGADPSVIQRITTKMVSRAAKKAVNAD